MWGLLERAASPSAPTSPLPPRHSPTPKTSTDGWEKPPLQHFPAAAALTLGSKTALIPLMSAQPKDACALSEPDPANGDEGGLADPIPQSHPLPFPSFPSSTGLSRSLAPHPAAGVHPDQGWPKQNRHGCGAKTAPLGPLPKGHKDNRVVCRQFGNSLPYLPLPTKQGLGPGTRTPHPTATALPRHLPR